MYYGSLGQTLARKTQEEVSSSWVRRPHKVKVAEFEINPRK